MSVDRSRFVVVAEDGAKVEATTVQPPSDVKAHVVCVPAMGVDAAYYMPLVDALVSAGFAATVADLRGHGSSDRRPSHLEDYGYAISIERDLVALVRAVMERQSDDVPLVLLGHSLGGHFSTLLSGVVESYRLRLDALVLVASGTVYSKNWSGLMRKKIDFGIPIGIAASRAIGYFPGKQLGFAGKEARTLMKDWAHNARTGVWKPIDAAHSYESLLTFVDLPVLAITFEGDDFAPPASTRHLLQKIPNATKTNAHLSERNVADPRALHHFKWARFPADVVETIRRWWDSLEEQ
ncbi:MAG: alpha/beta fold hydrolase [Polyangiales bacterium]